MAEKRDEVTARLYPEQAEQQLYRAIDTGHAGGHRPEEVRSTLLGQTEPVEDLSARITQMRAADVGWKQPTPEEMEQKQARAKRRNRTR